MFSRSRILTLLLLAVVSQSAQARWFEVEVLLFKHNVSPQEVDEQWPQDLPASRLPFKRDLLSAWWQQTGPCVASTAREDQQSDSAAADTFSADPNQAATSDGIVGTAADDAVNDASATTADATAQPDAQCTTPMPDDWPTEVAADTVDNEAQADAQPYLLTESQFKLNPQWQKLQQDPRFTPLLHFGWREDMTSRRYAKPLRIVAGHNYAQQFLPSGWPRTPEEPAATAMDDFAATAADTMNNHQGDQQNAGTPPPAAIAKPEPLWELSGSIQVSLKRWLRVDTVLTLREPGQRARTQEQTVTDDNGVVMNDLSPAQQASANQQPFLQSYRLDQFRRVRSSEIHYFDHPLMGMIIQIRTFTPPNDPQDDGDDTDLEESAADE